jgi:PIN domain nuclease of toxin-antitoxin system
MGYLLDTHSFLWSVFQPDKLGKQARTIITNSQCNVYVSSISFWEISLKTVLGKLELKNCSPKELPGLAKQMRLDIIELDANDAASFHQLPRKTHKDPLDRMIIWQAINRDWILISKDHAFDIYSEHSLKSVW